jgi:hypothetical protein
MNYSPICLHMIDRYSTSARPPEAVDLVSRLLQYSPNLRSTAVSIKFQQDPLNIVIYFLCFAQQDQMKNYSLKCLSFSITYSTVFSDHKLLFPCTKDTLHVCPLFVF